VSKPSTNYQRIAEPVLSCGAQLGILLVIAGIIFGGITILSSRAGNGDKATFNTGVFVMGLFPFIMGVGLIGIDWFGRRSHALIILHDASSGKTEALEKIDNRAAKATVTCTRCHQPLERVDMSRGAMTVGSNLPTLYAGVICNKCGKVECSNCKGSPVDKPCSWCGGAVSPAYEHLLSN
jgi:hypothetical protein